ncbi:hypothetical protein Hanom_Chr13g01202021 [Helianthus anomalus]
MARRMARRRFRGFMSRRRFRLWSRLEKARGELIVVKVNGEGLWWMVVQREWWSNDDYNKNTINR